LSIVKHIAVQYGEGVLNDPARLKAFFGDLAKDEPKPLRIAFGRCVEAGAYIALKTEPDAAERSARKAAIAQRVRDEEGMDTALCAEALDILEAALFGDEQTVDVSSGTDMEPLSAAAASAGNMNPQPEISGSEPAPPPAAVPESAAETAPPEPVKRNRTLRNALIAAGLAVLVIAGVAVYQQNLAAVETARLEAEQAEAARVEREKAAAERREAAEAEAARAEAARVEAARVEAARIAAERAETPENVYSRGQEYYNNGDYGRAITEFTRAIRLNPNDERYYNSRGNTYYQTRDFDRAVADFTEAIRLNPNSEFAYAHRGEAYRMKGLYDVTIKDCDRAIKINPSYDYAYASRGAAYYHKGQTNQAIADLEKAISLYPNYPFAQNLLTEIRGW
jgi:tetratricopeptide (TPR) repeat protein